MNMRTNHTQYMSELVDGVMDQMTALYCREDFSEKIHRLTDLQSKGRSTVAFHRADLERMCEACNLDPALVLNPETADAELAALPTRDDVAAELFKYMNQIWQEFPTSQQVLERVTRRLLDGRFAGDSLPMAIVKQFLTETDYGADAVLALSLQQLTAEERLQWETLPEPAQRMYLIDHLKESVFDILDAPPQWKELQCWLRFLLDQLKCNPAEDFRFSQELAISIAELLPVYPGRTEPQYLLQSLLEEDCLQDAQKLDAIISQAKLELSRYLKNFPFKKKASGKESTLKDKFIQSAKDFKKLTIQDYPLLQLARDLSEGRFYSDGRTKEQLYLYAVAFDMRVYFGLPGEVYDPQRDLVKNLFHDYYTDNLLRYILNPAYLSSRNTQEAEPSGEGINYKNYKEVIFLYYLTAEPNNSIRTRMRKIQSMINGCSRRAKTYAERVTKPAREKTVIFRNQFVRDVLPLKKRKDLQDYLCTHYYIAQNTTDRTSRLQRSPSGNTAREQYRALTEAILSEFPDGMGLPPDHASAPGGNAAWEQYRSLTEAMLAVFPSGLGFQPESYQMNNGPELQVLLASLGQKAGESESLPQEENPQFLTLLHKLDDNLQTNKKKILQFLENRESTAIRCTRTELITLYYCYFYFHLTLDDPDNTQLMSLPELFRDFSQGADEYLTESGYQCISRKNLYDVFVVFALYLEQLRNWQMWEHREDEL